MGRGTPRGGHRPHWITEVALLGLGYLVYEWLRSAVAHSARIAMRHASDVYALEQTVHIDPERWANRLLTAHPLASVASGYYYAAGHLAITVSVLIWLYWCHPERYRALRRTLVIVTLVALAGYWVYPLAPPRLALPGLTDTVVRHDVLGAANPHGPISMINLYAAMPSLHVAWAVWVAIAVRRTQAHPAARLAWAYPLLTTVIVVGTANHFLIDAVVGATITIVADIAVRHGARVKRQGRPPTTAGEPRFPARAPGDGPYARRLATRTAQTGNHR